MTDIVLTLFPDNNKDVLFPAPFILKSCVENNGFECKVFDWGKESYNTLNKSIFVNENFTDKIKFNQMWNDYFKDLSLKWIDEIKRVKPKWFGCSYISIENYFIINKFLELLKEQCPKILTILGGNYFIEELEFGNVDYFIRGPGEVALVELLKGNYFYAGINGIPPERIDVNNTPPADYSDVKQLSKFYKCLSSYTSKGCINKCKYCSEEMLSHIYLSRKAENIVEEMVSMSQTMKKRIFQFGDCLMNGHHKNFLKLIDLLKGKNLKWSGFYLLNDKMEELNYKDASESGLFKVKFGVETGSDRVRKDMGKSFNNETIYKNCEYFSKYNIRMDFCLIVGWVNETEEEFQETLLLIKYLSKYKKTIFINIQELGIHKNIRIYKSPELKMDNNNVWYTKNSTLQIRKDRLKQAFDLCEYYNIPTNKQLQLKG